MKICPSCNSDKIRGYKYEEGIIFLCQNCRLQWGEYNECFKKSTDPTVLQDVVRKNVHMHYMNPLSIPSASEYLPYRSFFDFLKIERPQGCLRILDVGCGNGVFVQECLRRGHEAIGIEANYNLRTVIPVDILNRIIFSPVEKVDTFGEPFDVITFWDSFEHMANGFEILDRLKAFLKKDGIVYLRVNNNRDIVNFFVLFALCFFPPIGKRILKTCFGFPDHVWNFSKIGIYNLLAKKHWKIISCEFSETPSSRFTKNPFLSSAIQLGYLCNKIIGGGKIGEYYIIA